MAPRVHLGGDEVERNCWTDDPALTTWAGRYGYRNDLQAWDCGVGNRSICSTECFFHVQQAKAALAAGFGSCAPLRSPSDLACCAGLLWLLSRLPYLRLLGCTPLTASPAGLDLHSLSST